MAKPLIADSPAPGEDDLDGDGDALEGLDEDALDMGFEDEFPDHMEAVHGGNDGGMYMQHMAEDAVEYYD